MESGAKIVYEFSNFRLDLQQRLLISSADGTPVPLSPKVFETLLYLVERRGELLDKATLLKAIWPNVVVEENSLNQNISALRRALGESPGEHRFIITEPGRGYRFVAEVGTRVIPAAASAARAQADTGSPVKTRAAKTSSIVLWTVTVLFLIGGTVLWIVARKTQERPPATTTDTTANAERTGPTPPSAIAPRASIAVVPFANLTGEPTKEYFSDGMAEELINTLARVPGLKVPARTSSFAYKGRNTDVRQIASDLGVSSVLEGSVRSAGERIRVTAQLVDGATGYHLWSQSYDRKFTDLFKLQEELSTAIVQALREHMHAELPSMVSQAVPTQDLEAYDLYLQARSLFNRSGAENMRTARGLLQQATARDPNFAGAFSLIAVTHLGSFNAGLSVDRQELDKAEQAARHALSLDPDRGPTRATLAQVNVLRGNWRDAHREYQSALSLDAQDSRIRSSYTLFLGTVGRPREALQAAREADRLEPGVASYSLAMAAASSVLGLDADAVRYADRAVNLGVSPDLPMLRVFYSHAANRRADAALAGAEMAKAFSEIARQSGGDDAIRLIYAALVDSSKKAAALDALREWRARSAGMDSSLMVVQSVIWYTMLGALDSAYEVANPGLDKLRRSGSAGGSLGGLWIPEMRPFRQDSRFGPLMDRMGLLEYWKEYGPPDDCEFQDGKLVCH
jgi:TolB-like protein/DNA-binding winged helix-turn-helix (wHTH) protein